MRWIDGEDLNVGDIGFLVEVEENGAIRYGFHERPCHTNMSHEPKLIGWCGSTNNVSRTARGLAKVVRIAGNGRVQIMPVTGVEGRRWLENVAGYPDLAPEEWATVV